MAEQTITIKIRGGDQVTVPRRRLTTNSAVFQHLLDELKYDEHYMDDFSPEAVHLFLNLLEKRALGGIEQVMFRELHKLATVFEVGWLREGCRDWLKSMMKSAFQDQEKTFLFNECWYIFKKWDEQCVMKVLVSTLSSKDNSSFISSYMTDLGKLETGQIDLMLILGGSNTHLFLRIVLQHLYSQNKLQENVKYLIQNMNLAFCCEQNEDLYLEVFKTISSQPEISMTDLRFALNLTTEVTRSVTIRKGLRKTGTTLLHDVYRLYTLHSNKTLSHIIKAVSEGRVTSMFVVVDLLLYVFRMDKPNREDTQIFLNTLENMCRNQKLQRISGQYLNRNIAALKCSRYVTESHQMITLLTEIKNNGMLSTYQGNVIIKCDKKITVSEGTDYKYLFTFKHPATGVCTEPGSRCGFIVRRRRTGAYWERVLCTKSEDYKNTGVHYHDNISAHEIFWYDMNQDALLMVTLSQW